MNTFRIKQKIGGVYGSQWYIMYPPTYGDIFLTKEGMWVSFAVDGNYTPFYYKSHEEAEYHLHTWIENHPEEYAKMVANRLIA